MNEYDDKNKSNQLLKSFLEEPEPERAEFYLSELFAHQIFDLVRAVISRQLRSSVDSWAYQQIAEDLFSEAVVKLLATLRKWKLGSAQPKDAVESNFQSYVFALARNVCSEYLRNRYPRIRSLQDQLRYWLRHDAEFSIWKDEQGIRVCGLARRQGENLQTIKPEQWQIIVEAHKARRATPLKTLLESAREVLRQALAPVPFTALTTLAAEWSGINREKQSIQINEEDLVPEQSNLHQQIVEAEQRQYLFSVWQNIKELSTIQRRALLLNLNDGRDRGLIVSFVELGIATMAELADVLELPLDAFLKLWHELPLEDENIAALFNLTRQQIINHRFAARKRLTKLLT
ncbi:MAG TPA: hypothetical protein PLD20_01985 [Blastocatellia bacterium]|nr:hypothetical protein [Blastocatellia bacterium]HMV83450.1 hypothetical protein [Blastocatellia bacterium]HMY75660.1 hypothetical protein [Blastocatellia bacterium]HMZ16706.1 hypothetical protein [Blastocatellia bacterium]HNG28075.1 hypothetical protein [Blastocatellia bacterium]